MPYDPKVDEIIAQRRVRDTPSPKSPSPTPPPLTGRTRAGRRRGKSKLDLAGLIGGDSDSSALTQESGDEGMVPPTPRDSVTITEGGTEYGGDEDAEMRDVSPGASIKYTGSQPELTALCRVDFAQQIDAQEAAKKSSGDHWEGPWRRRWWPWYDEEEKEMIHCICIPSVR